MKNIFLPLFLFLLSTSVFAQADQVSVVNNEEGMKLIVNGDDFMINGMNWDYFPIGTTVTYSLWTQSDDIIMAALDREMSLLKNMGVNVIRQYTGVQPKWIKYIYEKYGIFTMLNHSFGRYGLLVDGTWMPNTEYADPRVRQILLAETKKMVEDYRNTPGLIMYLLGNENNYGLSWGGAETEDIPLEDRATFIRARAMYKLFNEATVMMKGMDTAHPVAMCNGDLLYMDLVIEECQDIDIYGTNMYRGVSFGDAFERVKNEFNKPIMFTEFGADAFHAVDNEEDQFSQAYYMLNNWHEIYDNAAGMGKSGNSIGGFTFQFSDGWWKFGQTDNLDMHDSNASWESGGYAHDHIEGENNMNEEWFGICAKGPTSARGLYNLYPRAAYYALKEAHQINPYKEGVSLETTESHFAQINLMDAVLKARGDKAALLGEEVKKIRVSDLRGELSTFNTGGRRISTPDAADPDKVVYPNELGFDHMQSFFVGVEANPASNVRIKTSINVLGQVAQNPIDQIFYENRGRPQTVSSNNGDVSLNSLNRVSLYQAEFSWNSKMVDMKGFYRTGHYHWGYEGDFFGLYPEANYGPNIDIYGGTAPFGVEMEGKKDLKGFKVAFGPELWWGANPAILLKYSKEFGKYHISGIFHEDLDEPGGAVSSFAVPIPRTRRATLHIERELGPLGIEVGGIWGGQPLVGRDFQIVDDSENNPVVYQDEIQAKDTWGGKVKLTYSSGPFNWYAQSAAMGLVANGGADYTQTYTGWRLKDSGSGNQLNFLTGFTYTIGDFQIAPNFLWQKPIVDPIPSGVGAPGRPRNILNDPFAVRANRETVAGEILFTFDPTPGTWMYSWDNDMAEDAPFALSAGFVFRHLPTTQDAGIGISANGRSLLIFPRAPAAQDLWEAHARVVTKFNPEFGIIANIYGGNAQSNGSNDRLIERFGTDIRMIYKKLKVSTMFKVNDWGPFDYHRDFNLTFPLQLTLDLSTTLGKPQWIDMPDTRAGIRGTWRSLNQYSPRYCPTTSPDAAGVPVCDPEAPGFDNGQEWEIRTYIHFNIGK